MSLILILLAILVFPLQDFLANLVPNGYWWSKSIIFLIFVIAYIISLGLVFAAVKTFQL